MSEDAGIEPRTVATSASAVSNALTTLGQISSTVQNFNGYNSRMIKRNLEIRKIGLDNRRKYYASILRAPRGRGI